MYGPAHGTKREWSWDPPAINQAQRVRLSAQAELQDVVSMAGQWNNARVIVRVPVAWEDLQFELWARVGSAEFPVRSISPAEVAFQATANGFVSAELFEVCGWVVDAWIVKVLGDGTELVDGEITLMAWGTDPDCERGNGPQQQDQNNQGQFIPAPGSVLYETGPLRLTQIMAHNVLVAGVPANTRYLMLFDQLTAPVLGQTPPVTPVRLLGDQQMSLTIPPDGHHFRTGIVVASSVSDRTYTAPGVGSELLATIWYTKP